MITAQVSYNITLVGDGTSTSFSLDLATLPFVLASGGALSSEFDVAKPAPVGVSAVRGVPGATATMNGKFIDVTLPTPQTGAFALGFDLQYAL